MYVLGFLALAESLKVLAYILVTAKDRVAFGLPAFRSVVHAPRPPLALWPLIEGR